jgi:Predicted enzyme related to lactoylglutathione lyase
MVKPIENRVDTIFVHVTDLHKSMEWYSRLLGLEIPEGEHNGPIYTFDMGPGRPGLTLDNHCFEPAYAFTPSNQPLFNLGATDIEAAYRHVRQLGTEYLSKIVTHPDLAEFTFKDPDGNLLMVCTCFT